MTEPRATVREVNGQVVLDDPDALAFITDVARYNCRLTFQLHAEAVARFARRMRDRGDFPDDVVIVLLNVDDPHGGPVADLLMPGHDWEEMRRSGQVPFARGLAKRAGLQDIVTTIDGEIGEKLKALAGKVAVIVMDHGVVEVFEP